MRNRMYFGDLLVTREIKALDSAWEEFVFYAYKPVFNWAGEDGASPEDNRKHLQDAIDWIERARVLYLEERARLKGKFSKREEESAVEDGEAFRVSRGSGEVYIKGDGEAFSDPLIVDDLGEVSDRKFKFNEHPEVKEKVSDGLEEFLRRTLKEDE